MIAYRTENGINYPAIYCDTCGKEITIAAMANVTWTQKEPKRLYFVHKGGACDTIPNELSEELTRFLRQLQKNAHRDTP